MIRTGLIVAAVGAVVLAGLGWLVAGPSAAGAGLLGLALAALAMAGGQAGLVAATDPRRALVTAFAGYVGALVLMGAGMWAGRHWLGLPGFWLGVGAGGGALTFLAGAIWAYTHARIPLMEPAPKPGDDPGNIQPHE